MREVTAVLGALSFLWCQQIHAAGTSEASRASGPVELTCFVRAHDARPLIPEAPLFKQASASTGVNVKFVTAESNIWIEKFNLMLASGDMTDIVQVDIGNINRYARQGVFLPFDESIIATAPNLRKTLTTGTKARLMASDGKIYAMASTGNANFGYYGWIVRKDWLEMLGLETPLTTEQWYETLKAFTRQDPNGNGKNDEHGLTSVASVLWRTLAPSFGLHPYCDWDVSAGNVFYVPLQNGYRAMLDFARKLYQEGLLDPEFAVHSSSTMEDFMLSDGAGVAGYFMSRCKRLNDAARSSSDPRSFEFICAPPPRGPLGYRGVLVTSSVVTSRSVAVSYSCRNPEAAVKWLDFLWSEEGMVLSNWGVEGLTYSVDALGRRHFLSELGEDPISSQTAIDLGVFPLIAMRFDPELLRKRLRTLYPSMIEASDAAAPDYYEPPLSLPFTDEESDHKNAIQRDLTVFRDEMTLKYVLGQIADWEAVVRQFRKLGVEEYVLIHQAAYDRYTALCRNL